MDQLIRGVMLFPHEKRGSETHPAYEWKELPVVPLAQITSIERAQGVVFGNHFHKGEDPSKKPEIFMLLSGTLELLVQNKFAGQEARNIIHAGTGVTIEPHILHTFIPLSKVVGIEVRITEYKPKFDTYSAEEYEHYQISQL